MSSHRATSSARSGGEPSLRPAAGGQSHYQLLELSPQASPAELRQAFRNLSKRYHPDTTALPQAEAREAFARLRQAYAVLADPDSRRAYDAALLQPSPPLLVVPPLPTGPAAAAKPLGVRRSLSGGEWFALVLLGLALALSLVLGVGLAWARGAALVTKPSWWTDTTARTDAIALTDTAALSDATALSAATAAAQSGSTASGAPAGPAPSAAVATMPALPGSSPSLAPGAALHPAAQLPPAGAPSSLRSSLRPPERPEAVAAPSAGIRQAP